MMKQTVQERRCHVRARRVLCIQFKLAKGQRKGADQSWGLSTTQDMSPGGVSFYTEREYCAGDILDLHVIMSGIVDVYRGYGKVVRVARKESGVYFLVAAKFIEKQDIDKSFRTAYRTVRKSRMPRRV